MLPKNLLAVISVVKKNQSNPTILAFEAFLFSSSFEHFGSSSDIKLSIENSVLRLKIIS